MSSRKLEGGVMRTEISCIMLLFFADERRKLLSTVWCDGTRVQF